MEYIVKTSIKLSNDKIILYKLKSWRLIVIQTNCSDIKFENNTKQNRIVSITFDDLHKITIGDIIEINYNKRNYKFYINYLIEEGNIIYLAESERNISTRFIIPVLGISRNEIGLEYLFNAYLYYESDDSEKYLYLCYRYIDDDNFKELETKLRKNINFVSQLEPNSEKTIFKFKIPDRFIDGVKLLVQGKYSKISEELKRTILRHHNIGRESDIGYILYRNPEAVKVLEKELRIRLDDNIDIFQKMNKEDETYRISSLPY